MHLKPITVDACIELGCLTHARRKFLDLHKANPSPMALAALNRIAELHAWLLTIRAQTANGRGSAKALNYS